MYDSVIKIQPYYKDIFIGGEIFKLASYKEREEEIITLHKQHHDNNLPDKKMRYIRLGTFPVTPTTTIDDLKVLCDHIRQEHGRKKFKAYYYYEVMQKRLNAVVLHDLGLDVHKEFDEKLLKSYLKENYKQNELVFDQLLDELRHKRLSKKNYSLLKYMTVYMKKVCKGELK